MNRLAQQTSPYLLQHADNPVDWYPWDEEALARARAENKPILLSIGYSACHWCHVMAHESFEDEATAAVMNELFVNIKVDREERPDLDKIYQTAHQLLTQRTGGWPLTMFLNPVDQTPFFGGTYFPSGARHGLPAFTDLMKRVAGFYHERGDEIAKQDASLREVFERIGAGQPQEDISDSVYAQARQELANSFDHKHGGFGQAPKFPHPTNLEFLFDHWQASIADMNKDEQALHMLQISLYSMASGGLNDQIGGGFYRYSVDDYWMIPHFEKMLYDNGPLLALCARTGYATGDHAMMGYANETADWAMREMQSPQGGYYSTLDADSEGEEGRFYVWTPDEVRALLSDDEYRVVSRHYGLDRDANFEGNWHLHVFVGLPRIAEETGFELEQVALLLDSGRQKLFQAREQRVHPGRDEKILTSWNGLMIRGMAVAGRLLDREDCVDSACRAVDFIHQNLWQDSRLLATCKDGTAHLNAYLDDYVFLLDGVLELLQARWNTDYCHFAIELADAVIAHFCDEQHGGFYFTSNDHERLLYRPKPYSDESTPSGNGIAIRALLKLGHLVGDNNYLAAAERAIKAAWPEVQRMPYNHTAVLNAARDWFRPAPLTILRGGADSMRAWQAQTTGGACFAIPANESNLPGLLAERTPQGEIVAYRCEGTRCQPPVTDLEDWSRIQG